MTPLTRIIVHPSERPSKCTVEPLRGRDDLHFHTFTCDDPTELDGYVRLGLGGTPLSEADADHGLLVLDGTWRYAERMERAYGHVPVRSLVGWRTAYPRVSKLFDDPGGGLATVEALYAAHVILGRSVDGMLDHYHWRDGFLQRNAIRIEQRRGTLDSRSVPTHQGDMDG